MYIVNKYNPIVEIRLGVGLYQFNSQSSTGKTWLYNCLKDFSLAGENVVAYTYNDYLQNVSLLHLLKNKSPEVVLIDRYDMYLGEFKDLILELSKTAIVLVDCKQMLPFGRFDNVCGIVLEDGKIEVYG